MEPDQIQLLQFLICRDFRVSGQQDSYVGDHILGNIYTNFPFHFDQFYAVTCWRKDKKFHKEVIEYETDYGNKIRSPHMDIEPVTDSVLFRWHKHRFPQNFPIDKPTRLTLRVILDWEIKWESYVLIEQAH